MIKTLCPECATEFQVDAGRIGKKAKCGECGHVFTVEGSIEKVSDATQHGWLSLYLAGLAILLLLFRGSQGGLLASLLFAMAIETAALFLAWRGLLLVLPGRYSGEANEVTRAALLVNGILMALFALSLALSIHQLVARPGGNVPGMEGLGGNLNDILKNMQEMKKLLPQ
jgi:predicted Zn finger-like uncharacterized protein